MATPLFYFDDELKSVSILSQSPERTLHIVNELIKDKILIPGAYDKVYFDFPCEVAPLEITSSRQDIKYRSLFILSGYVGKHDYISFKEPFGTQVVLNVTYTFKILDALEIKYNDEMKSLLKDEERLCNKHGFYRAYLESGKSLILKDYGKNINITY